MSRTTPRRAEPSEATKLAKNGKLNPEAAEPLWREACGRLPKGERPPYRQVTFTLHVTQLATVQRAIKLAKGKGATSKVNANSNGNAIAKVCRDWLKEQRKTSDSGPGKPKRGR